MQSKRLLALVIGLVLLTAAPTLAQTPAGTWHGVLQLAAGELEVVITLERSDDGWSGAVAAPALDLEGTLELSDIQIEGDRVGFTVAGLGNGVRLTGELAEDGDKLVGESAEGPPGAPPATDIYLFEVGDLDDWSPAPPINITDRDGYDNQPFFLPDGSGLLYTSIRDGQADIYRYDLSDGTTHQVTDTPESEYSPTPMPWGPMFSTVRVEADGTQRLWGFALDGGAERLLIENVEPVGYHAWVSEFAVALFVLGDPPTLELFDVTTQKTRRLAEGIGRSLHSIPGSGQLSFVRKVGEQGFIEAYDPWIAKGQKLVATRPGSEDLTWTADGRILMGEGSKLYLCRSCPQKVADPWVEVADLESFGVRAITRLALSPVQRHLAVVGGRTVPPPPSPDPSPFQLERQ